MRRSPFVIGGAVAASMASGIACTGGQTAYSGVTEPIQIPGAQFIAGDLPGAPPIDGGGSASTDAGLPPLSFVENPSAKTSFIIPGSVGVTFNAATTTDVVALGVRLGDQGTGYWVVPATQLPAPPTSAMPASINISFSPNFNAADAPGFTSMRVVAIGSDGSAGTQVNAPLCIESRVPDNGHACSSPANAPPVPAVVITLQWDTNFDVDLNVIIPSGLIVNPKTQVTTVVADDEGGTLVAPTMSSNAIGLYDGTTGVIDRDSIGSCVVDGWRQEDLVFQDPPPHGFYDIYANPFASCGQPSVRFTMTIYERGVDGSLHPTSPVSGELLASQTTGGGLSTTGGAATGLFVLEKQF